MLADPARYGDRNSKMDDGSYSLDTMSLRRLAVSHLRLPT
jgi:hypothetical protein